MALFSVQKVQEHTNGPGIIVELFASYGQLLAYCKQLSADSCPRTVSGFLDGAEILEKLGKYLENIQLNNDLHDDNINIDFIEDIIK